MLNLVVLEGRATEDVTIKEVKDHKTCTFFIAVNDWRKDAEGKNLVSFMQCVAWDKLAEAATNIHKGDLFSVTGRLQVRSYIDKNKVTRQVTEVIVDGINYLSPKQKSETRKEDLPF